jgi:hypothetical protein
VAHVLLARELYRPGDFVVLRLDIDDGAAELELLRQVSVGASLEISCTSMLPSAQIL